MRQIWQRLRKQWFRILLAILSLGLLAGVLTVVLQAPPTLSKPSPLPVAAGDYEIAWLYPATNTTTWQRFVAAMKNAEKRLAEQDHRIEFEIGAAAFPQQATTVPEVAIRWRDSGKRLVFRWYKLSAHSKTSDWIEALAHRQPPPLAVIGGGNSYSGLELAKQMRRVFLPLPEADQPLMLLATTTVNQVAAPDGDAEPDIDLHKLYPERTFRFCFTDRQMAVATTRFIWEHDDLRPEADPVFQVAWKDDVYSPDLLSGYEYARANIPGIPRMPLVGVTISSGVGTYHAPNHYESEAAGYLLNELTSLPPKRRMLIVAGQFLPTRRFLQALARMAPAAPQHLVVVTGDAVTFNHIFRDRLAAWRTLEVPFKLVFFCQRNPIDAASGFDPAHGQVTGTDDALLFRDIVEAVAASFGRDGSVPINAAVLSANFHDIKLRDGQAGFDTGALLFREDGYRHGGTGEHVVCLRPHWEGGRVLSEAAAEVWTRDLVPDMSPVWRLVGALRVPDPQTDLDRGTPR